MRTLSQTSAAAVPSPDARPPAPALSASRAVAPGDIRARLVRGAAKFPLRPWPRSRRGFTLLEVMVALGVLAVSYTALMQAQSASLRLGTVGRQVTVATLLARGKMELIEDKLTREGFPDMDQEEEGTFEEEGYPAFRFRYVVRKVELPLAEAMSLLLSPQGGSDKAKGGGGMQDLLGDAVAGGLDALSSQLSGKAGDLIKGKLGGGISGMASMLANPDMLKANVEMLGKTLEQALRMVQLTVSWGDGQGDSLTVTTHLVQVPQAASAPGASGAGAPGMPGALPGAGGMPGMPGATPNLPAGGLFGKPGAAGISTGVFK